MKTLGRIPAEEIEKTIAEAYMNIYVDKEKLFNPLLNIPEEYLDEPQGYIAWLMMQPQYFHFLCNEIMNIQLLPMQCAVLQELWSRKFPMLIGSRGFGKTFLLAVYSMIRILMLPNRKVVVCGAAFRQSKILFEYMETIWNNAPILRDIVGTNGNNGPRRESDMFRFFIGESRLSALPIGTGDKIRGQRANDIIADEFAAIPREIFETVIGGFAAVSSNPIANVVTRASHRLSQTLEIESIEIDKATIDNQTIISGTADYDFNHFYEYWCNWKDIITTGGDKRKIAAILNKKNPEYFIDEHSIPESFKWNDYSIIRIPYEIIPEGFMDAATVSRAKASVHYGTYLCEYGACFSKDSNGFFKRSLIENCTSNETNPIYHPSGKVYFKSTVTGNPRCKYVYGIDPAAEVDNFAIVVLELHEDHRRVVYTWTTNKKNQKEMLANGVITERDYYSFCSRKIRDLMKKFPCSGIAIDSQGGGLPITERLNDTDKIRPGEQFIWPLINPEKPLLTDGESGLHIINIVNFSSAEWTTNANHNLKSDMETKSLVFPFFDAIELAMTDNMDSGDKMANTDCLESCMLEIEELKSELATIVISKTPTGRYKWDTPELKLPGNKKGRLRKDRYSALLMANDLARTIEIFNPKPLEATYEGGFAHTFTGEETKGPMYKGPSCIVEKLNSLYS